MINETPVRFSLHVNDTVTVFQTFANHELLLEDVICTDGNVGLVPNDVKCVVSKLHSCAMPVSALPVHTKLLNTDALGIIVPSVSLTTIPFMLFTPFGYCALVRYIVNVAGRFLSTLHEAVELL